MGSDIKIFMLWPTYWLYPITTYENEPNLSEGEIEKYPQFSGKEIGFQVIHCTGTHSIILRHIGFGYFKSTSKTLD